MQRKDIIRALQNVSEQSAVQLGMDYHGITDKEHERLLRKIEARLPRTEDVQVSEVQVSGVSEREVHTARFAWIPYAVTAACCLVFAAGSGLIWQMHRLAPEVQPSETMAPTTGYQHLQPPVSTETVTAKTDSGKPHTTAAESRASQTATETGTTGTSTSASAKTVQTSMQSRMRETAASIEQRASATVTAAQTAAQAAAVQTAQTGTAAQTTQTTASAAEETTGTTADTTAATATTEPEVSDIPKLPGFRVEKYCHDDYPLYEYQVVVDEPVTRTESGAVKIGVPAYVPKGLKLDERADALTGLKYDYDLLLDEDGQLGFDPPRSQTICMTRASIDFTRTYVCKNVTLEPKTISGCPGYISIIDYDTFVYASLIWVKDEYVFEISAGNIPDGYLEEMIRMAESVQLTEYPLTDRP